MIYIVYENKPEWKKECVYKPNCLEELMKKDNRKLGYRILRIILMVIVGLALIAGVYHVITNKQAYFSPPESTLCEEKVWCLDYDTVVTRTESCGIIERSCDSGERCSSGSCEMIED